MLGRVHTRLLLAVVAALSLVLVPAPASADPGDDASGRLATALGRFSGRAGIVVADALTGAGSYSAADVVFPSASLYKLSVMAEAYRRAGEGTLSLDGAITITDDDLTSDGYDTEAGTTLSLRGAIERMITVSDNSPALALVRVLGVRRINATSLALGMNSTRINTVLPDEERTAPFNTTTARDVATLLGGLARGTVYGPDASRAMLDTLARQRINDRLPAGLPDGTVIAHKTGNLDGVSHDAGVVFAPAGPRIVVMLTADYDSDDDVIALAERLAALAYATPLDAFTARYAATAQTATVARPGDLLRWSVQVTNASAVAWRATYLRESIRAVSGVVQDLGTVPLPALAPGASITVTVNAVGPAAPGKYVLELEAHDDVLSTSAQRFPLVFSIKRG